MPAIRPARKLKVFVGDQDWSPYYASLVVGRSSLGADSDQGKITFVGVLEIVNAISVPESVDPRDNPVRWKKGQDVYVQVLNDAGNAYIDVSFSRLKILQKPNSPGRGNLVLDVGCQLQWASQSQLDEDKSEIIYGQPEAANAVAARWLEASGIDAGNISLSAWPYSLSRPIGKDGQESFADQAADLAYACDWQILYQDANGDIVDMQLDLLPGVTSATVTVGQNDVVYGPDGDPESIPEVIKVAGTGYDLSTTTNPTVDVQEKVVEDFSTISPKSGGSGVAVRTITTKSFTTGAAPSRTKRVQVFKAEALVFQNPSVPSQPIELSDDTKTWRYETGKADPSKARLTQYVHTLLENGKSILPTDEPFNMRETVRQETDIEYGDDEPMTRCRNIERQAEIKLDKNSENPWNQRVLLDQDFQWTPYATAKFDRTDAVSQALIRSKSNIDRSESDPWALETDHRNYDRSEPNTPFKTEFFDPGIEESNVEYEGSASYIADGGSSGRDRDRLFTIANGFGFSESQMTGLAQKHLGLFIGRSRQYEIRLVVDDALLQAPPLPRVDVIDQDGQQIQYLADALTFEFFQDSATALCFGVWIDGGYAKVANAQVGIPPFEVLVDIAQSSFSQQIDIPPFEVLVDIKRSINAQVDVPPFELIVDITQQSAGVALRTLTLDQARNITLEQRRNMELG